MVTEAAIGVPTRSVEKSSAGIPTFREVVRALSSDEPSRELVLVVFKQNGGDRDRWQRRDVEAMASAITTAEDALEIRARGVMTAPRRKLRAVRRRLEDVC